MLRLALSGLVFFVALLLLERIVDGSWLVARAAVAALLWTALIGLWFRYRGRGRPPGSRT
jgi:hypothetical protein